MVRHQVCAPAVGLAAMTDAPHSVSLGRQTTRCKPTCHPVNPVALDAGTPDLLGDARGQDTCYDVLGPRQGLEPRYPRGPVLDTWMPDREKRLDVGQRVDRMFAYTAGRDLRPMWSTGSCPLCRVSARDRT